jgi:hypothetical protein
MILPFPCSPFPLPARDLSDFPPVKSVFIGVHLWLNFFAAPLRSVHPWLNFFAASNTCCDFPQKCYDLCYDFDLKNHSVLPILLRCYDFQGGSGPSLLILLVILILMLKPFPSSPIQGSLPTFGETSRLVTANVTGKPQPTLRKYDIVTLSRVNTPEASRLPNPASRLPNSASNSTHLYPGPAISTTHLFMRCSAGIVTLWERLQNGLSMRHRRFRPRAAHRGQPPTHSLWPGRKIRLDRQCHFRAERSDVDSLAGH